MNRSERLRTHVVDTNTPLIDHSLNQKNLKETIDGQKRLEAQRSQTLAQANREKSQREIKEHQIEKLYRIIGKVQSAFGGHDGIDFQVLTSEIGFLKRNGICFESILPKKPKLTEEPI